MRPNAPDSDAAVQRDPLRSVHQMNPPCSVSRHVAIPGFERVFNAWKCRKIRKFRFKIPLKACSERDYLLRSLMSLGPSSLVILLETGAGSGVTQDACESFTASVFRSDGHGNRAGLGRIRESGTGRDDGLHHRVRWRLGRIGAGRYRLRVRDGSTEPRGRNADGRLFQPHSPGTARQQHRHRRGWRVGGSHKRPGGERLGDS